MLQFNGEHGHVTEVASLMERELSMLTVVVSVKGGRMVML